MATNVEIATRRVASTNPATGELLRELDCASDAEVHTAVGQARAAQPSWAALGIDDRIFILRKFRRLLHENKTEVATLSRKKPASLTSKPC
jgi:malonate-semialdehyde dehydrogenase (acetylating) / methylmalonate-semialdehyde dehydrogenase